MEEDIKQGRTKEALEIDENNGKRGIVLPAANSKENWFSDFDGVLDDATNHEVFDAIGGGLLRQYVSGVNVSIMAYGQTGSGKTYTMFGCNEPDAQAQGLLHLVLNRIDEQICLRTHLTRLSASVFEVYNDELFSLLDAAGVEKRPLVKGMTDYHQHRPKQVTDACEAIGLVLEALQLRARDATVRNATSSRSHAFVKLRLEQLAAGPDEQGVDSTLFLVDLAGSESMSNASSSTQQSETIHINKSLQALERVVNSLSNCSMHVPYRDSLLTQVLQEGLDPRKARVALVTTVSRFLADVPVTKSTLMFAQRARNIRTFAQVNVAAKRPPQSCPEEIYRQLQNMQAINNKLRQQLADLESSHERQLGRSQAVEAMREELTRLGELHAELQRSSARQQHETEAALEAERAAHAATRAALVEARRANGELAAAAGAAAEEARAATERSGELRSRLAEAQLQVVRLNGELAGSQSLAAQVQAQHRAAAEQLVQAREQLTTLKGQLAAAEEGCAEYQALLAQQRRLAELAAEAAAARDSATSEASSFQLRVRELQHQLAEANQDAAGLAAELADTRQQVAALQRRITDDSCGAAEQEPQQALEEQEMDGGEDDDERAAAADAALCLQQLREQPTPQSSVMQGSEEGQEEEEEAREAGEEELQTESSDGAVVLVAELELMQAQLEASTAQLAEAEVRLAEAREEVAEAEAKAAAARAATAEAEDQLVAVRATAEAEAAALRQQLAGAAAARSAAAAAAAAAAASAVQEARSAAEAAAAERLVPLQTECERLRAMVALSEQQLGRLQAECERLRAEGDEAREEARRLAAERDRAREEVEAAGRLARLGAAAREEARDAAPRSADTVKQLQDRVRLLEADKKRSECDHRGQLELKDKLIRQLELITVQLQSEVTKLRQDTVAAQIHDQLGGNGDSTGGAAADNSSPFTASQQHRGSRSEAGASPGPAAAPADDAASGGGGTPPVSSAPPNRALSSGGILLLNRTTTGSAAALARNNSRAAARPDFSTPPPAPRYAPGTGPSPGPSALLTPPNVKVVKPATPDGAVVAPPPAAGAGAGAATPEVLDLTAASPESTPGPTPPRLTPMMGFPPLDDGLVVVRRGTEQNSPELKLTTNVVRNQMNY
ncbi:Kinesin-like protein kif17 [Pleodorina starrii]|uniref:Kinesin-like protein kif17 n=1 Tax=Pleodorina starrii TaxID=330485 RepID=A0A9W6BGM6_9CHLO|nr:Kinesin-like protein kif17 [Pleodorina starrii]GLC63637.1 Kinesin-like protein kif17 [Pleodorina starrii]